MTIMASVKVVVEKHDDGYVAYPIGMNGVVVGQGDTYSEAYADVQSAILFHVATFGVEAFTDQGIQEVFLAEAVVAA
jgi:predicted RNase H-like HicB family nuclease